ncbi:hypothetical protein [Niabella ginsengisoli]|uniref:PNPLA domain-containing protein n=1 Tax=Niabella ginsengisoli TaxID=522298 RepID=A0ABS9SDH4_9BACT|nr:hypothetical protein [Niabella ginsengisoli]MCH5596416.1 hypothetical protein [Niabella ginsengisoli]
MKQALVISGGGSKGAFAVVLLKELSEYLSIGFQHTYWNQHGRFNSTIGGIGRTGKVRRFIYVRN